MDSSLTKPDFPKFVPWLLRIIFIPGFYSLSAELLSTTTKTATQKTGLPREIGILFPVRRVTVESSIKSYFYSQVHRKDIPSIVYSINCIGVRAES